MGTESQAMIDRPQTMTIQGVGRGRDFRKFVAFFFFGRKDRRTQVGNQFVEDLLVARRRNVVRSHERQPQKIVGEMRAHPASRRRMPPVLHVSLFELPSRRPQNVLARQVWPAVDQGHDILQLIAITVGAARLIQGAATPVATTERLVQQPAVQHQVQLGIRRMHLERSEQILPQIVSLSDRPAVAFRSAYFASSAVASC